MGVKVDSGVFSLMVSGWSPRTGGSVVGRVENIPGGSEGEEAGSAAEPVQPIRLIKYAQIRSVTRAGNEPLSIAAFQATKKGRTFKSSLLSWSLNG